MGYEWLAIAMFGGFFLLLLTGYPVAFSFAGTSIIFGLLGIAVGAFDFNRTLLLTSRWYETMSNFTLLAIPYFVFLGAVLEKSGLAEDLLETVGQVLGPLRGGIALAVIFVGTLLAATTGVVAATVIVMGMLSLPTMVRYGYDKKLAAGVIISSGTLAQLLPPSIVLVVLADQLGISPGDLFIGALIPGLLLSATYALYVIFVAIVRPEAAPALPLEERSLRGAHLFWRAVRAIVPPFLLILAVLGSIFWGIATPTEAGAVGAVGACLLALMNRRLNGRVLWNAANSTARITGLVIMILFASTFFALVFDALGGRTYVTALLTSVPGGEWGFIIIANIAIFLLGIFLEFTEIAFIAMPLLVPAARLLGLDMAWFGVMTAINLQTAFISPPVGFSLFYLQGAAPKEVTTSDIHNSAWPFMGLQLLVLVLVIVFPGTVTWLVSMATPVAP